MSDEVFELKRGKESFASHMIGHQLLKEDPHDLLKTVADGFALVRRAQSLRFPSKGDGDAGSIFITYQYIADFFQYLLGEVVCETRSSLREHWQALLISPYADEYIALDKDINSWIEVAGDKLDKLRVKFNITS